MKAKQMIGYSTVAMGCLDLTIRRIEPHGACPCRLTENIAGVVVAENQGGKT